MSITFNNISANNIPSIEFNSDGGSRTDNLHINYDALSHSLDFLNILQSHAEARHVAVMDLVSNPKFGEKAGDTPKLEWMIHQHGEAVSMAAAFLKKCETCMNEISRMNQ
ncbi:hypothetical protein GCM10010981_09730 [Dyella nitratireducens]|uniref:Uncharacterized protein n=1 Tax=Dyella nitratireducens TaxID=1849580 RepID=A0ABQ1FQE0_9GAMM|nr:hypothetical protein GCM10010981_09730 [Dyella nitratireducens]